MRKKQAADHDNPYDGHCQVAIILIVINYPHCYDHSRSQVAIPAENDVIDLTVTAQQGFGGRRPKPKKKYSGNFFSFVSILFVFVMFLFGGKDAQSQGKIHCCFVARSKPKV